MKTDVVKRGRLGRFGALLLAAFASGAARAGTVSSTDPFYIFFETVNGYAKGALGISLALASMLFGSVIAVGSNKPVAALVGVALAAIIYFAPTVILNIFGAVLV